jgi:hypothetical protein
MTCSSVRLRCVEHSLGRHLMHFALGGPLLVGLQSLYHLLVARQYGSITCIRELLLRAG